MSVVRVKVPASTANLGPGFDCLGIALQIYNWVTIRREASSQAEPMVAAASEAFFHRTGERPFSFLCKIAGEVPRSRGLGSSVTVRLGVLHGLNELSGSPLNRQELFELCAELEGHPDNAAPAAFGGFTIARGAGYLQRYRVDRELAFALLIPDFEVSTREARGILPKTLAFGDAVASVSNACAIAGAFALVTAKSAFTACARSTKSATASYCDIDASSGRCARTSQLSATVCPVLVPPMTVTPPARKWSVASIPLKYWYQRPVLARIRDEVAHLTGLVRHHIVQTRHHVAPAARQARIHGSHHAERRQIRRLQRQVVGNREAMEPATAVRERR